MEQLTIPDWLSYSVRLALTPEEIETEPIMTCPDGLSLVEYPGTNMFKRRAILYDNNGDKIVTLLWQPHSSIIDSRNMLVEVANPLLYSTKYLHLPELLQKIHCNTWVSLSRLDLATDFQPTPAQQQVIDMLQQGSIYVQGKREGTMWHSYNCADKYVTRRPHQMAWGNKASQIKWKLYNKSKEIYETTPTGRTWCNKPYIADYWSRNGFASDRDTWRLEVSIMGSGQLQWHGHRLAWDIVSDPDTYTSLYYDLYETRMKMRLNQGHTNKRYDEVVEFLRTPDTTPERIRKAEPGEERTRVTYASTLRALVKELDRPEIQTTPAIHQPILDTLGHIVHISGLGGYFAAMMGQGFESWAEDYTNNRGMATAIPQQRNESEKTELGHEELNPGEATV